MTLKLIKLISFFTKTNVITTTPRSTCQSGFWLTFCTRTRQDQMKLFVLQQRQQSLILCPVQPPPFEFYRDSTCQRAGDWTSKRKCRDPVPICQLCVQSSTGFAWWFWSIQERGIRRCRCGSGRCLLLRRRFMRSQSQQFWCYRENPTRCFEA